MIKKTPAASSAAAKSKKTGEVSDEVKRAVEEALKTEFRNKPKDPTRTRTMTVKLDHERYKRIGLARFNMDMSAQDIFVEALDAWFRKNKI